MAVTQPGAAECDGRVCVCAYVGMQKGVFMCVGEGRRGRVADRGFRPSHGDDSCTMEKGASMYMGGGGGMGREGDYWRGRGCWVPASYE